MRKSIYISAVLFMFFTNLLGINSRDMNIFFENGNQAYLSENYEEAVQQYETALNNGFESGILYYNLGNAYYKLAKKGLAILNYEKAKKWLPNDENVKFNLMLANLSVKDKIEAPPEFILFRWHKEAINIFTAKQWAMIFTILFILAASSFACLINFDFNRFNIILRSLLYISLIFCLLTFYPMLKRHNIETNHNTGLIIAASVKCLSGPQEDFTELFVVHEGTKLTILDEDSGWYKIELIDGKQGWIPSEDIGKI